MQINKKQFETLFQLYWKRMFLFTVKTVADEEDAKEIVQEVFKSLWERSSNLELADAERYLLRSVKLKSLEYLRNKGNKIRHHKVILHNKTPYYEDNNFQYKELKKSIEYCCRVTPQSM